MAKTKKKTVKKSTEKSKKAAPKKPAAEKMVAPKPPVQPAQDPVPEAPSAPVTPAGSDDHIRKVIQDNLAPGMAAQVIAMYEDGVSKEPGKDRKQVMIGAVRHVCNPTIGDAIAGML